MCSRNYNPGGRKPPRRERRTAMNLSVRTAMLAGICFLLTGGLQTAQASDCKDIILGTNNPQYYSCTVKGQDGSSHPDCFQFYTSGGFFGLYGSALGDYFSCSCRATKSFSNPAFDEGKEFLCVIQNLYTTAREAYTGKAAGNKIKKGEIVTYTGFSWVFECEKVPFCS